MSLFKGFLLNAAALLAVALIFDLRARRVAAGQRSRARDVVAGLLVGLTGVITMLSPIQPQPGILLDSRGLLLLLSGLFFGPVPTVIAMAMTSAWRTLVLGGPSWPVGVVHILATGGLGLLWGAAKTRRAHELHWSEYALGGLSAGLIQLGLVAFLLRGTDPALLLSLAPTILVVSTGATLILGLVLADQNRRARLTAALAEREASFRSLTEQLPAVVYRAALDEQSTTLYVSPAITRTLGYSVEEWLADPTLFVRCLHPDDRDRVLQTLERDRQQDHASNLTYRFLGKDGEYYLIQDYAQVVRNERGEALFLQGAMFDITEVQQAARDAHLRAVALESAADAVLILDREGRVQWANPAFTTLTQYTLEEARGRNPRDILKSGEQDDAFYAELWATLLAGNVWSGSLVNRRKDGTRYTEEQSITPVRGTHGTITHFIAIKRDVSERRQLEQQYRQAQKMEGIGRLAAGVAHDFNNLLTVINGTVELALPSAQSHPQLTNDLLEIRRAGDRAARLVRQLLAFSRQQVLKRDVLDLNHVLKEMVDLLKRTIGEDITFTTRFAEDAGAVHGDASQLEQVLLNLVVNARDAMPDGGELTIETAGIEVDEEMAARHVTMQPGPHVLLAVRDTGVGMDAATKERIFEPFFTTKAAGKGTGLGLPTAYGIVKQMGGSIWVFSEPGRGTTFKIYLPRVDAPITERPSGPKRLVPAMGNETVLVVEDEDSIRLVAVRLLTREGYRVLEAASGEEALGVAALEKGRIDLLMTDMVMPGMTGPELAKALLERQPTMRVLFTSGYSKDAVAQQFGITDGYFISKPYGLSDLTRAVRAALDGE